MTQEPPIACSLDADDYRERLDEIRAIGARALLGAEDTAQGAVLRFRMDPDTLQRLRAVAAAEQECCAFLSLGLDVSGSDIALTIGSPPDAAPVVRELVRGFQDSGAVA